MSESGTWIEAKEPFQDGDVLRWEEAIWSEKKRGRGNNVKNILIGKQQVTGQIESIEGEFITLKVLKSEMIENNGAKKTRLHQKDSIIRKKPATLLKGKAMRLAWEI